MDYLSGSFSEMLSKRRAAASLNIALDKIGRTKRRAEDFGADRVLRKLGLHQSAANFHVFKIHIVGKLD